ncbi:MAG: M55 family metallopeptidase [bacterium]
MKIMIMTDMEGVAGVLNHDDWVQPKGMFYDKGVRLLTGEVNAAIDGCCSGGATEIVVVDGHGAGGIDSETLDPRALLMRGCGKPAWPWELDASFSALVFVGQHAKAGTAFSHITHTQWFNYIDLSINGLSIGEYGQLALCAMELGVPTILACGEAALCAEAEALTPGVVTVNGKRGLLPDDLEHLDAESYRRAKLSAVHKSPAAVRLLIRDGARAAVTKLKRSPGSFLYPQLSKPYTCVCRFRKDGDKPAYEASAEHPGSIIALMNLPLSGKSNLTK